jgi:hypothetical protein
VPGFSLFLKFYETLVWLLVQTADFTKNQRFLRAKRMEVASFAARAVHGSAAGLLRAVVSSGPTC